MATGESAMAPPLSPTADAYLAERWDVLRLLPMTNRITQLQTAHPFLTDDEARQLLCAYWAAYTQASIDPERLQQLMADTTEFLCAKTETAIRKALCMLPNMRPSF